MCGIVGILGTQEVAPLLVEALKRLEYRGYDSAGIATLEEGHLHRRRAEGKLRNLADRLKQEPLHGLIGIGHTRWATHGRPVERNAHPHATDRLAVVHNGIIENFRELRDELEADGIVFETETDTEVVAHLVTRALRRTNDPQKAVSETLPLLRGAFALGFIFDGAPDLMIAARQGAPLAIGYGEGEMYLGSDALALAPFTDQITYLDDGDWAVLTRQSVTIYDSHNVPVSRPKIRSNAGMMSVDKGNHRHYMAKEIHEQPRSIQDCLRGRLNAQEGRVTLGGIKDYEQKMIQANRLILVACGTSWHAALVGEYLIEDLARINVEVEYASEFRYRNPILSENDVVIAISQSGETADTMAALELAKSKGATILGICNVVGSSISRITDAGSYTHAGPEIGVASTKAFTAQVTLLTLVALSLAHKKGSISETDFRILLTELEAIPEKVKKVLETNAKIEQIALEYKDATNALYLGRGSSFPVALEGALKLKEISYIHAEGYPAAEMKHGPIALIDENMPVFVIATKGNSYEKVVSNIQEVKARKGKIIAIVTEGDTQVREMADHVIEIPETNEILVPLLATIPFQLLSYHIAVMRNCNVDQPRNLAKSVTVE